MPNYISTSITRLCPDGPPRPSATPGIYLPPKYGAPNLGRTVDTSPLVSATTKTFIMEVVGTLLFYARMVDHTMLPAIMCISKTHSAPTEQTWAAPIICCCSPESSSHVQGMRYGPKGRLRWFSPLSRECSLYGRWLSFLWKQF